MREIIDADKEARHRVEQKKLERQNIQHLIQEKSTEIKSMYHELSEKRIAEEHDKLEEELALLTKHEQADYENALTSLQNKYDEQKNGWIETIVNRCLNL